MTTLRERLIELIREAQRFDNDGPRGLSDDIIAAVHEHLMSEEAIERGAIALGKLPHNYTRLEMYRAAFNGALGD